MSTFFTVVNKVTYVQELVQHTAFNKEYVYSEYNYAESGASCMLLW